jgi:integrase
MTQQRTRGTGSIRRRAGGALAIRYYDANAQPVQESVAKALGKRPSLVTETDAERLLQRRLGEVQSGTFIAPSVQRLTMADLFEAKRADLRVRGRMGKVKTARKIESDLGRLERVFGPMRANTLTTAIVQRWLDRELEAGAAPGTLAKLTDYLRATLRYAVRTNQLATAPYIPRLPVDNARQNFMTPEQTAALLAHASAPIDDVIEWARLVGWRREEIFGLTWDMVHRDVSEIRLPTSKNGHPRVIPMVGQLAAVVDKRWKLRALGCPFVFHVNGRRLREATWYRLFHAARVAAGLPDARLHDYRRVAYRDLRRAHVDQTVVMDITGHRSVSMAKRYAIRDTELMAAGLLARDAQENAVQPSPGTR